MWTKEGLLELIETRLRDHKFILVSNREPYVHRYSGHQIECVQPASGLAVALDPIMRACGGTWIAHGSGDADRITVDNNDRVLVPPHDPRFTLRRVWLNRRQEEGYYYGLANQALWPLCHIVFTRPTFRPEDWQTYREVNQIFARAVLEEAGDSPTFVFIQDFHFALLPRMLKERNANLIIAQFWHIPWPNPEVLRGFPWKEELLDGMLGNDLLGFHLRFHCQNFLDTVDRSMEAKVDRERQDIIRAGKPTSVRPFPISIDFEEHNAMAQAETTEQEMERWRRALGLHADIVGIGIDRLDYTKGICERLRALDRFLTTYPQYQERLVFVQVGVPSRSRIPEYKSLEKEIEKLVNRINKKYRKWSSRSWRPIIFIKKHFPQHRLTALHRLAHFCVVSSLHDGMNLVAKEYVASRFDEDGVLILSDFAGSSRELTDAIVVNPFSEEEFVEAIRQALEMSLDERKKRMRKMRAVVAENNIYRWAGKIVSTLLKFEFTAPEETHVSVSFSGS
ncbi:MAG: trehalose-6-phosphate synthase [Acidobacteria bacterium]|nr:MAG: trehalose-6-phosphate synthase [Acidobacteriota bacterium]